MSKRKLDLNQLLSKYEGVAGGSYDGSRIREQRTYYQQPTHEASPIEEEFYHNRTGMPALGHQQQSQQQRYDNTAPDFKGKFSMSRSECEQFLMSIRGELRSQERHLAQHGQEAIKNLHQKFMWTHEALKKDILALLQRSFVENERAIKEELARQSKIEPLEFTQVYKLISSIDSEIERLIAQLKTPEYRRAIADVVTRDFEKEIYELRSVTSNAKTSYMQSLGAVQPDRSRVEAIKQNLTNLFYIKKPQMAPSQMVSPAPRIKQDEQVNSIFNIFRGSEPKPSNQNPPINQSRTRKSFFNFGGGE